MAVRLPLRLTRGTQWCRYGSPAPHAVTQSAATEVLGDQVTPPCWTSWFKPTALRPWSRP